MFVEAGAPLFRLRRMQWITRCRQANKNACEVWRSKNMRMIELHLGRQVVPFQCS